MNERLNLEQFRQIKSELESIVEQIEKLEEQHGNDENYDFDVESQKFEEQYFELQQKLLRFDLSDIPSSEWMNIEIFSDEDHIADFSMSRANIDFSILGYSPFANYKNCKIENIGSAGEILNSEHFDSDVVSNNPNFFFSDSIINSLKQKNYDCKLTMEDIVSLSDEQIEVLTSNGFIHGFNTKTRKTIDKIGFEKAFKLCATSKEDYNVVCELFDYIDNIRYYFYDPFAENDFEIELKNTEPAQLKNILYSYIRKILFSDKLKYKEIIIEELPELFVNENSEFFLIGDNIPEDLRQRYYARKLTIDDIINHISLLKDIPISNFTLEPEYESLAKVLGDKILKKYIETYPEIFNYIIKGHLSYKFSSFVAGCDDLIYEKDDEMLRVQMENYLNLFFLSYNSIDDVDQLNLYDPSFFPLNKDQQRVIDLFGLENIKKFDKETGFFSYKDSTITSNLQLFGACVDFFNRNSYSSSLERFGIDFKDGTLPYEEFVNEFAKCIDLMRKNNVFSSYHDYDFIEGEFRDNHPEIFISPDAPEELKTAFYEDNINLNFLFQHKECLKYLTDKDLSSTIREKIDLIVPSLESDDFFALPMSVNFYEEYASRYGNEKLLVLLSKYGEILSKISINSLNNEIDNEKSIEQSIKKSIYNAIKNNSSINYAYLSSIPDMVSEYPEIFVDFSGLTNISTDEIQRLTNAFYNKNLSFDDIKKYPELVDILKDKDLEIAFGNEKKISAYGGASFNNSKNNTYSDLNLLKIFGNEKFLELCSKYGRYIDGIVLMLGKEVDLHQENLDFQEISQRIENIITRESIAGNLAYRPDDAPTFLRDNHPELFLSEDAPADLKKYFYNYCNNYPMSFEVLQKNTKEWMPFLRDKALTTSLLRNNYLKQDMIKFFNTFGIEKAIKLGLNRAQTVKEMLKSHQVDLMKSWYDKTGGKFIPDFVVMQNFRIDEADKFLNSAANWSNLMRIKGFAKYPETREAMLKLAYSFGAFDQDQKGFKKLKDLLTEIPRKINADHAYIFERLDTQIDLFSHRAIFFSVNSKSYLDDNGNVKIISEPFPKENVEEAYRKMIEHVKNNKFNDILDTDSLLNLLESLKEENVDIDFSKDIFAQIYRKNEDGSCTLTINAQSYPKSTEAIRNIIEKFREIPMLSPDKAHQLFGGFELKYDPDFREFLLANMEKILNNPDYISLISRIQKQFSEIKAMNSNRTLTLDLAISYVQANKYSSINIGNERVAEISAIAGYTQEDFLKLQEIYNYGKQRTFSSIPRIEQCIQKGSGMYTYETLRLDDPLAMAIGTLTDCCQELNNCAEICMEHSMVDKNGRIFVIRDEQGNIVAQSWVWRNKDVLCFDNIEIPDKAFARTIKDHPEIGRKGFTDEIFEIYNLAAQDLMEEDEKKYKELLECGKITQDQYDGLRLGKITVGLGYNDIAESLMKNSYVDKGNISRPLPFDEPVKLSRGLYTNDSVTQYILKERDDRKQFDGDTLPVHSDTFIEYTDSNFTDKDLLYLEKLEIITKENPRQLETSVSEYAEDGKLITEIAKNYGLNPETSKIIMNANFAIIYDINDDKLRIGELLFNTKVDNESQQMDMENQVLMQMRLALEQIASDKSIDVSNLDEKQKEMYKKITDLTDEIDIERGVGHAR